MCCPMAPFAGRLRKRTGLPTPKSQVAEAEFSEELHVMICRVKDLRHRPSQRGHLLDAAGVLFYSEKESKRNKVLQA